MAPIASIAAPANGAADHAVSTFRQPLWRSLTGMERPLPAHLIRRAGVALAGLLCGMLCAAVLADLKAPVTPATETLSTKAI